MWKRLRKRAISQKEHHPIMCELFYLRAWFMNPTAVLAVGMAHLRKKNNQPLLTFDIQQHLTSSHFLSLTKTLFSFLFTLNNSNLHFQVPLPLLLERILTLRSFKLFHQLCHIIFHKVGAHGADTTKLNTHRCFILPKTTVVSLWFISWPRYRYLFQISQNMLRLLKKTSHWCGCWSWRKTHQVLMQITEDVDSSRFGPQVILSR